MFEHEFIIIVLLRHKIFFLKISSTMIYRECIGDHIKQIIPLNDLGGACKNITDNLLKQLMVCYKYITNELNISLDKLHENDVIVLDQDDAYSSLIPNYQDRYCL